MSKRWISSKPQCEQLVVSGQVVLPSKDCLLRLGSRQTSFLISGSRFKLSAPQSLTTMIFLSDSGSESPPRKPVVPYLEERCPPDCCCSRSSSWSDQLLLCKNICSRPGSRQKLLVRNSGAAVGVIQGSSSLTQEFWVWCWGWFEHPQASCT